MDDLSTSIADADKTNNLGIGTIDIKIMDKPGIGIADVNKVNKRIKRMKKF